MKKLHLSSLAICATFGMVPQRAWQRAKPTFEPLRLELTGIAASATMH